MVSDANRRPVQIRKPVDDHRRVSPLSEEERVLHREQLRRAREGAYADSEGFASIIRAMEALGRRVCRGEREGLGEYVTDLAELVVKEDRAKFSSRLLATISQRNAAVHTGALARNLTQNCVHLALVLEEGLLSRVRHLVANFMVRPVVTIEHWHTFDYVRLQMLEHGYSFLPIRVDDAWKYLTEESIAALMLRSSKGQVRRLRHRPISSLISDLDLVPATLVKHSAVLAELRFSGGRPNLVVDSDHPERLLGIIAAADVM